MQIIFHFFLVQSRKEKLRPFCDKVEDLFKIHKE